MKYDHSDLSFVEVIGIFRDENCKGILFYRFTFFHFVVREQVGHSVLSFGLVYVLKLKSILNFIRLRTMPGYVSWEFKFTQSKNNL
ncbi:hypothetical protein CH361_15885 [Leptospira brenneri]|nr:hypothetical protein CH361_15885 [Leptospira brenneri]